MSPLARFVIGSVLSLVAACSTVPEPADPDPVAAETRAAYAEAIDLMRAQEHEQAIEALRSVSARDDSLAGPYVNMGIAYRALGKTEDARKALEAAIARDPASGAAYNQLGLIHREAGRFEQAREVYMNGLDEDPDHVQIYRNLGILCDIYLQDLDCALANFKAYQERSDGNDETLERWIADVERRQQ